MTSSKCQTILLRRRRRRHSRPGRSPNFLRDLPRQAVSQAGSRCHVTS